MSNPSAYHPPTMDQLIARMDSWLRDNRSEYYAQLLPQATEKALVDFEQRFSLHLPNDFRALYSWRNGQPPDEFDSFQDNRMFLSIEDITETKEILDGMIGHDFDDPKWWRQSWVPFLSNGGGDYLCLDLAAADGGNPGQLIAFWHADQDRTIEFSSLAAWLTDLVESMENGTLELT